MSLAEVQKAFGAHLRDPEGTEKPEGLDSRRVEIYQELVFNNVEGLMANNFPVINDILSEEHWLGLIREFLKDFRTDNPYFPKMGNEFINFLDQREPKPEDPDFLLELAHYENIEFDLFLADEEIPASASPTELLPSSNLCLASTAVPLAYQYPVHQISKDWMEVWQPEEIPAVPTFLLVFQDTSEDVRFFELQGLTYHLLTALEENKSAQLKDIVKALADTVRSNDPSFNMDDETFLQNALSMLKQFQELCVLRDNNLIGE